MHGRQRFRQAADEGPAQQVLDHHPPAPLLPLPPPPPPHQEWVVWFSRGFAARRMVGLDARGVCDLVSSTTQGLGMIFSFRITARAAVSALSGRAVPSSLDTTPICDNS